MSSLEKLAEHAEAEGDDLALLLIDLSNLRHINHQHSFSIGDVLLSETDAQLRAMANRDGTVFRISSHIFAVIIPRVAQLALLPVIIGRMRSELEKALEMDAHLMPVRLQFGVGLNRGGELSALLTLAAAEAHLEAQRSGQSGDLDDFLGTESDQDMQISQLIQPFAKSLRDSEFQLYYQPKVDSFTGQLLGAEALLRWPDPQRGFISPEVAIQVAEMSNRIFDLTKWVAHTAARQHRDWSEAGVVVPLSINIPPSILTRPDLSAMLEGAAHIWNVPEELLTLEITEQGLINDAQAATRAMERLKGKGFRISIDDFGTGYSSLSYFHDIPASELKIDRSFVMRLLDSERDRGIVRTICDLARIFNMKIVAEGVEDGATLQVLREVGCDVLQGFGVSRPMPAKDFVEWLASWDKLAALETPV